LPVAVVGTAKNGNQRARRNSVSAPFNQRHVAESMTQQSALNHSFQAAEADYE
jgi:hypothetical protein